MTPLTSSLPVIVMGLTSMLLQITALRLLLSTFSGNELDIGITLSFWLIYVGIGSYAGKRISFKHAFWISFSLIALLSLPTVMSIKAIRTFLSLEPGETVSFIDTVSSTAIALFPLCFVIGLQFPLAVSYAGNRNAAGRIYGLEALGAFGGGVLFTFMIASRINALELCLILSLLNLITAVYLSRKKIVLLLSLVPLLFYFSFHATAPSFLWHGAEIIQAGESKLGEIAVIKMGSQSSIYANGQLVFSYPDVQAEEMIIHLPMTVHPSPKQILIVGGSPGTLKELLKYRVDRIDFVELDPRILDFSLSLLNTREDENAMKDSRIHILIQDGRRFIKSVKTPIYDLIILNLPQPSTASINRFYTIEFFREAQSVLRQNGILAMHIPQSAGYMGKRMQMASGSVYNSLRAVFQSVAVTSQEYGMLFSSDSHIDGDPDALEKRFAERDLPVKYFHQYIFRDAFSSFGVDYVKQRLSETKSINTDFHPSAYLFSLMLWADMHGGKALHHLLHIKVWHIYTAIIIILSLLSVFLFRQRKGVIFFSVFTTGFSGMFFVLTAILSYQSLHGYVYEMIGMLSAFFMIGLWAGTSATKTIQKPIKTLFVLEICTICLAVLSLFLLKIGFILYFVVFSAGIISGAQFSTANLSLGESTDGGRLYALDLIGSFIGALISSLIIIPLAGIPIALFFMALIKAFSAMLILSLRPFYRN